MRPKKEKIKTQGWIVNNQRWLAGILAGVLLILSWFLLLGPQFKILRESGILQYLTLENDLAQDQAYLADLKLMQLEYDQLDWRDLRKVELVVPAEQDYSILFGQLEKMAQSNNLKLLGVNILSNEDKEENKKNKEETEELPSYLKGVTITLNLEGGKSYQDFKNLIEALEDNAQIFNIKSLVYVQGNGSYNLTLDTYYLSND